MGDRRGADEFKRQAAAFRRLLERAEMADFDLIITLGPSWTAPAARLRRRRGGPRWTHRGVGDLERAEATQTIHAGGLTVIPGIADCHAHSDLTLLADPRGQSMLHQGVTTSSTASAAGASSGAAGAHGGPEDLGCVHHRAGGWTWRGAEDYLETLDRVRPAYWSALMAAHGRSRARHGLRVASPPTTSCA